MATRYGDEHPAEEVARGNGERAIGPELGREVQPVVQRSAADERQYQELVMKAGQEETASRAGKRLLKSIRRARRRLKRVPAGEVSRSTMRRDARVVARKLRRGRQGADELAAVLSRRSRDAAELAKPAVTFHDVTFHNGDAPEERRKQYAELRAVLDSLERQVKPIMRQIGERHRTLKAKQRQYERDSKDRYNH